MNSKGCCYYAQCMYTFDFIVTIRTITFPGKSGYGKVVQEFLLHPRHRMVHKLCCFLCLGHIWLIARREQLPPFVSSKQFLSCLAPAQRQKKKDACKQEVLLGEKKYFKSNPILTAHPCLMLNFLIPRQCSLLCCCLFLRGNVVSHG